jgi:hypothetical protein
MSIDKFIERAEKTLALMAPWETRHNRAAGAAWFMQEAGKVITALKEANAVLKCIRDDQAPEYAFEAADEWLDKWAKEFSE